MANLRLLSTTAQNQREKAYTIHDFFPDCMLPDCPDADVDSAVKHQHILPKQQDILSSTEKYLYMQGGVGGGKSVGFAVKCVWLCLTIAGNRGVVSRFHYDDLFDSSWRKVNECITALVDRKVIPAPSYTKKVAGEYTQITFHNGSEIKAIQGKNWHRGLGADHGFFWVDDALECLEEFFIGTEVSAGLLSRLRLPQVRFDRTTYHKVERPHGSLHGMVSTNPPPYGHWMHKLFGNKPGIHRIGDDSVEWLMGETTDNPFGGEQYARGLIAVQAKMGRNVNTVRRVIFGESVPAYGGIPVYPQFEHAVHVAPLKFKPELPLIAAWDFGHDHPAVVFANLHTCSYRTHHYFTLSEVAECFNLTVYNLYDKHVKPHIEALYTHASCVLHAGDRSGYRRSSSNKDRRSDMRILIEEYHLPFHYRYMSLVPSLQYMRSLLEPRHPCKCGLPLVLISDKCPVLIGALEGGYRYAKPRSAPVSDKPREDKYFADVACAWRYGAENFAKWGVPYKERLVIEQENRRRHRMQAESPYAWLDATDAQMAQLIIS